MSDGPLVERLLSEVAALNQDCMHARERFSLDCDVVDHQLRNELQYEFKENEDTLLYSPMKENISCC